MAGSGRVRMEATSACTGTVYHLGMMISIYCSSELFSNLLFRFVLKTKEQRKAEKALMDKSPLNTLTLEDFLESERHKLTGTLTPVTPETFAKWKKERLDKKAAEAEALKAREATGRAMFESGDWKDSEDEDSEEDDSSDNDDDDQAAWNLEDMRKETERLRALKEEDRLAKANGDSVPDRNGNASSNDAESQQGDGDADGVDEDSGEGPSMTNGESSGTRNET